MIFDVSRCKAKVIGVNLKVVLAGLLKRFKNLAQVRPDSYRNQAGLETGLGNQIQLHPIRNGIYVHAGTNGGKNNFIVWHNGVPFQFVF